MQKRNPVPRVTQLNSVTKRGSKYEDIIIFAQKIESVGENPVKSNPIKRNLLIGIFLLQQIIKDQLNKKKKKKSRIRETKNLSTDADRRTDTILERLRDLSKKNKIKQ